MSTIYTIVGVMAAAFVAYVIYRAHTPRLRVTAINGKPVKGTYTRGPRWWEFWK